MHGAFADFVFIIFKVILNAKIQVNLKASISVTVCFQ